MCANGSNCFAYGLAFVASQIVHDDDIAGPQGRCQVVGDIELKDFAVHRSVEDQGGDNAFLTQAGNESRGTPVAMRRTTDQALPTSTAAMASMHVGLGPGLINEDQAPGIEAVLIIAPPPACGSDVRPVLFVGQHGFF